MRSGTSRGTAALIIIPMQKEYTTVSGLQDLSTIGRHTSIAATPGIAVASR